MKKLIFFLPIFFLYIYAAVLDEPRLDVLLPTPESYSYISDGSNITVIASNGNNGILNVNLEESFYSSDFDTTLIVDFNYAMNWTGQGYNGVSTKTNWTALDTYYDGVRVIVTFDKMKRYAYIDLYNKTIKYKFYSLYKINIIGHGIHYFRDLNDSEAEISSSSYSSYLSSFDTDTTFNSLGLLTDTNIPTDVKNKIFEDLLYNYSPTANAGLDQTVDFSSNMILDASSSSDIDGTIETYLWKEGSTILSTSQSFTKSNFSVGTHTISLTVTDNKGLSSTDVVIVVINSIDNDNDGISNLQEVEDGTNPNDANSRIFTLNLNSGWNFISLELNSSVDLFSLGNQNIEVVRSFQNNQWYVWTKDSATTSEQSLTTLEDGYGYWIKAITNTTVSVFGSGVVDSINIQDNKWNMLGSLNILDTNAYFMDNPNVKVIWKYSNNQWYAISSDSAITNDLNTQNISLLDSIDMNEGFIVK